MKLTRPKRAQESETIIALIDVVFFLLVFFMIIGRMDATAPFTVEPPIAQSGKDMPAGGATIAISQTGAMALDGFEMTRGELEEKLTEMLGQDETLRVRINAHRNAELRHVLPLVGWAESIGIRDVVLVVTPTPEP